MVHLGKSKNDKNCNFRFLALNSFKNHQNNFNLYKTIARDVVSGVPKEQFYKKFFDVFYSLKTTVFRTKTLCFPNKQYKRTKSYIQNSFSSRKKKSRLARLPKLQSRFVNFEVSYECYEWSDSCTQVQY